jgi:glycosyltransferase involved in cell wall biosynthesis
VRLLTVGSLPPEWGGPLRGGAATFHAALLEALLERDGEVEVAGVLADAPLSREIPIPACVRPADVGRAAFYEQVLDRLRPDAVLMNHVAHTVGVTHARLGTPVPAVGVIHSWHSVTFRSGGEREHSRQVTEEALGGMNSVVAPSRHTLAEGRELGFRYPAVTEVIHNPLPSVYLANEVDVGATDRSDVVFLGSLISRKDPLALVEAAALVPGLNVLLIGEGELEAELRERTAALGIADRVRLAGPLPDVDHLRSVRSMLLNARIVCVPSRSESFGMAFIEALASGAPIVGFGPTVREIRNAMGIEIGEPLDGGSPEEIAAALERVEATSWNREQLRRATIDAFGPAKITDRYVGLLRRTVRNGGPDPMGATAS